MLDELLAVGADASEESSISAMDSRMPVQYIFY